MFNYSSLRGTFPLLAPVNYIASSPIYVISLVIDESIVHFEMPYFGESSAPSLSVPFQLYDFGEDQGLH
jgi:hypothetical protein